jgi:hypothetical protein
MGDSITAFNGPGAQPGQPAGSLASGNVINLAAPYPRGRVLRLGERLPRATIPGDGEQGRWRENTTQMLARFERDVLGLSPLPA